MYGIIVSFDDVKKFGFIKTEDFSVSSVYVHSSSIKVEDLKSIAVNDTVEFDFVQTDKGPKADNVRKVYTKCDHAIPTLWCEVCFERLLFRVQYLEIELNSKK